MFLQIIQNYKLTRRHIIIICVLIFLLTISIRLLGFQDNRLTARKIMPGVTMNYKNDAQYLLQGNINLFLRGPNPPGDANILAHPPGYPIFVAAVFRVFGNSDVALQVAQSVCDALAAVIVFLIADELLSVGIAIIAATLVSLSPQLSFYSLLLLPDSLAAVPILGAVYLLVRASKQHHMRRVIAAGVLLGISCWLRSNGLLLAIWLVLIIPVVFPRRRRLRYAAALVGAMIITIAPITIRNIAVFHHFIPLSLGSGITLLEGVTEYDKERRFGLPANDEEVGRWEREIYNRPDYLTVYAPDGIERDRNRFNHGRAIIRSHPFWFLGVMLRRAAQMMRYERVATISNVPATTHPLIAPTDGVQPALSISLSELKEDSDVGSDKTEVTLIENGQTLRITGDGSIWGDQIISPPIIVQKGMDYLLEIPVKVEQGRSRIKVVEVGSSVILGSSVVPDQFKSMKQQEQTLALVQVPFVSGRTNQVRLVLSNEDPHNVRPITQLGEIKLFILGEGRLLWTRCLRIPVHFLQALFLTVCVLPLFICGVGNLIYSRKLIPLAILSAVPTYYLVIQAFFHTENRYVIPIQYFSFIIIAAALHWIGKKVLEQLRKAPALDHST